MASEESTEYRPDRVSPPGETLQELLTVRGMSQAQLAERSGRPKKTINEIVRGHAAITPETALQLELVLGVPASFWLRRESDFQEWKARDREAKQFEGAEQWLNQFPYSEMVNLGLVGAVDGVINRVRELLGFFRIAAPGLWKPRHAAFRRSSRFDIDSYATEVLLQHAVNRAESVATRPFDRAGFVAALATIKRLSRKHVDPVVGEVVELCAKCGVAVVHVDEIKKTRLAGATLWTSPSRVVIALTHRQRRDDHLWFAFFHEAGHAVLHPGAAFVETAQTKRVEGSGSEVQEAQANEFARDQLIDPELFTSFVRERDYSREAVLRFARELAIAPGIVVGRLQHDGLLDWATRLHDLKRSID